MENKKISWMVIAIVILIGLVCGAGLFLTFIFGKFNKLNPNVSASIIAGFVAIFGVLYNQRQAKNREINEAHRLKKSELYKKFMDVIVDILMKTKKDELPKDKLPEGLEKIFMEFTSSLIIWGSPKVIAKYENFREAAASQKVDIILYADDLLKAMRSDLNVSNWWLWRGSLVKLFLKDPKELDKFIK